VPFSFMEPAVWTVAGHIDRSKSRHERLLGSGTLLAQAAPGTWWSASRTTKRWR